MTIEQVVQRIKINDPEADTDLVVKAYNFAIAAHGDQKRKTGEPYIQHPLHTAFILAQMKADLPTILAGLLHDVPEDTKVSSEEVKQAFGEEVASMVEGITKLRKIRYHGVERYRESLKKMFLAMATDIRVVFVKFADRLHNLQTLEALEPKKRIRIAKETLEIYAPIAGLLGIWRLKWQMEDICFKYLYPEEYQKLEYKYEIERKVELTQYIQKIKNTLSRELDEAGIKHRLEGRFKHLFSIWQKMEAKDRQFDEIYDVFALRVVVNNVADCYNALGVIHTLWRPNYSRFKDYIAVPKPNGYRSLHTTVFGLNGKATEFQIRTEEMHQESLYGLSAHLYYKQAEPGSQDKPMRWMQEVLEVQKEIKDTGELIKQIKLNIFQDRIFVFTPKGDVYDLPKNSTPVDFAYAIHTDIGNKCTQSIVNGSIAELSQELKNGDMVAIITDKNRKGPNSDWLKFVKTRKAKNRIKQHSKKFRLSDIKKMIPGLK